MTRTRTLRRVTLGAVSVAAIAVVGGCGGSQSFQQTTQTAELGPGARRPAPATEGIAATAYSSLTRSAQYVAMASVVNLRPGDAQGFIARKKETKSRLSLHNKAFEGEGQYRRCFGAITHVKPVFKASSESFAHRERLSYASARSTVEIMPTASTVQRGFASARRVFDNAASRQCLARLFNTLGAQSESTHLSRGTLRVTLGGLRIAPVSLRSLSGTNGSFGLSLSTNLTYFYTLRGRNFTYPTSMRLDELVFAVGRVEVELGTIAIGPAFPAETEARLLSLLVSRAVSARPEFPEIWPGPLS
jgi:hypothetical protein